MKRKHFFCFALIIFFVAINVHSQIPGNATDTEVYARLSYENAMLRMGQIKSALESFAKLAFCTEKQFTHSERKEIGNLEWDIRNLGIPNWSIAVEGTLMLQNYRLKQAEAELADYKFREHLIQWEKVLIARDAVKKAKRDLDRYIASVKISD